tara:strand:+ start:285 stop:401 length:117 start_codon:yes stop_codon:yes gene_type:complete
MSTWFKLYLKKKYIVKNKEIIKREFDKKFPETIKTGNK